MASCGKRRMSVTSPLKDTVHHWVRSVMGLRWRRASTLAAVAKMLYEDSSLSSSAVPKPASTPQPSSFPAFFQSHVTMAAGRVSHSGKFARFSLDFVAFAHACCARCISPASRSLNTYARRTSKEDSTRLRCSAVRAPVSTALRGTFSSASGTWPWKPILAATSEVSSSVQYQCPREPFERSCP